MNSKSMFLIILIMMVTGTISCRRDKSEHEINIIFLHHSTGDILWRGKEATFFVKVARRISGEVADWFDRDALILKLFERYNKEHRRNYLIEEMEFPKAKPYGWKNYPFDYYNIWVKNGGNDPFMKEPTLEILAKKYEVIIFKHCFPVSNIKPDNDSPDINSEKKTISNYKLQYSAIRDKLHEFPDVKFILFTGASQVKQNISEDEAIRAKEFFNWVTNEWDLPDDNIYIWDLYNLETEGALYFRPDYAVSENNSHPNSYFAGKAVPLLFDRIVDVIENNGNSTTLKGEFK